MVSQEKEELSYTVSGTVTDALNKQALPGISITLSGVSSAMTDEQGFYSIKLPNDNVILHVSGPGVSSRDISVRGRNSIDIELHPLGYKSSFGNIYTPDREISSIRSPHAWSVIKENTILSTAPTSDAILQGKAAGLNVVYRSGAPGAGANVYLRGFNSINSGAQPLYVVDGIPYENAPYSTSLIGNYYSNPLASIDIKDIETITVMKDGTSLYGVKGANGVILIRTIKARDLETKINFHAHTGINYESSRYPILNATDNKLLISELLQSGGLTSAQVEALPYINTQKPELKDWGYDGNVDYYRYNHNANWQNEIYAPSFNQNYYLNVFGGDEVALYALSVAFLEQSGSIIGTDFKRFNTRFNSEINLTTKLKLRANMSFVYASRNLIDEGPFKNINPIYSAMVKSPFMAVNIYNSDASMSPALENYDMFSNSNPYALIHNSDRGNTQFRFVGNLEGEYKFNENFQANALIGVNFNKERERLFYSTNGVAFDTLDLGAVRNEMRHRVDRIFSLYSEGSGQFNKKFNANNALTAKVGIRYQMNQSEDDWGLAFNSGSDNFRSIGYGDPLLSRVGGSIGNWNWMSFFGTVDYGLMDKYFFNFTTSADASSRFGKNVSSFLLYPSLSAAWLVSGEEFLKDADMIDMLKLRTSFGISGNDNIGNYSAKQYYVSTNILGTYGLVRGNLVDFNLRPETSTKFNVGVDASLLTERVNFSLDFYSTKIDNLITLSPALPITGFKSYITNGGSMQVTGIDFAINSRIINTEFTWDLGFVAGTYKNKITSLKGDRTISRIIGGEVISEVGQPMGQFYGYKTNGIYATQQEAAAEGLVLVHGSIVTPFSAGDVRFVNSFSSDNIIDEKDKQVIGDPNPDLFGSITNDFGYDRWSLSVFMLYSLGNDVYNYTRSKLESVSTYDNQTTAVLNRWKKDGDITSVPRAMINDPMGNSRFSDRWIEDGSYLKMKKVSLAYRLPVNLKFLNSATFFANAENLFTLTKYKGSDPEFAIGQNILNYGVDAFLTPQPGIYSIGVKLEL
ncbi:MAG: SusC/RagA family TonB-linked outer membrane protein [Porphyromonadaceae bacterium]|nr:SusC/RagA family TonB-linked outer membrane protein [Porphyromonadaceae bacterium]